MPAKKSLRKITVDNQIFLWKVGHFHLEEFTFSKCCEKVVIYLENHKKSPLQLSFREEDNLTMMSNVEEQRWCIGYPETGALWITKGKDSVTGNENINLNRPAVIRKIIEFYLANGWNPAENKKPLINEKALELVSVIKFPAD